MQADWDRKTDLLPLAAEGWWHAAGDGQGTQCPAKKERSGEEDGRLAVSGHGGPQGTRERKLVSPDRRQRTTTEVRHRLGLQKVLERRGCRVLDQPRSTQRYQSRRSDDEPRLLREMRALARQRPRFGGDRIDRVLVERHWQVNHKRVRRLWK